MPNQHLEPQKFTYSAPEAQAQASPLVTASGLPGLGKAVNELPEADRVLSMLEHGLPDQRGERVLDPIQWRPVNLRRV